MKLFFFLSILLGLAFPARAVVRAHSDGGTTPVRVDAGRKMPLGQRILYRALERRVRKQLRRHERQLAAALAGDSCDLVVFRDGDTAFVDVLWTTSYHVAYRPCGSRQSNISYFYKRDVYRAVDVRGGEVYVNPAGLKKGRTGTQAYSARGEMKYRTRAKAPGSDAAQTSLGLGLAAWASLLIGVLVPPIVLVGPVLAIIAVIFGIIALRPLQRGPGSGRGKAIAGIVLGSVYLLLIFGLLLLLLSVW